ncbi:MAG: nucleotidyltransferase domain-containing protein [Ignavibacteriaceae bacterium]|nr:nucleotidyltransferase domain-containing protein [Ignavibacteriaceae bacterium]
MNIEQNKIVELLNKELSLSFPDYLGAYFYGSRLQGNFHGDSDYDVVLLFESIEFEKESKIAGVVSLFQYKYDVIIDYILLTAGGKRSIEYMRQNINPVFIQRAIDKGKYYKRQPRTMARKLF